MKNKFLSFLIIFSSIILVFILGFGIKYCCSYKYISTTGIYIKGLNSYEIGAVSVIGLNKKNEIIKTIYCFEQYRKSDDYIYKNWRRNLKFYDLIDKIIIRIPDTLNEKVDYIWIKSGTNVFKCSGEEFRKNWFSELNKSTYEYKVPENIIPEPGIAEGFVCLLKSESFYIKFLRKLFLFFSIVVIFTFIFRFKTHSYNLIKKIWSKFIIFYFKKIKIFKHLYAFCLGIIFVFFILEFSLRIIGYFHTKNNIKKQLSISNTSTNSILCIGDSFTESIGSTNNNDYPSQLGKIINEHGFDFQVINLGRSGKNTAQISMEMPYYISTFNPKIAVILAGGANYWNYWGYKKESFWSSLKTVKLFKLLFDNIQYQSNKDKFNIDEYNQRRIHYKQSLTTKKMTLSPFILNIRSIVNSNKIESLDSCLGNIELAKDDIYHLILFSLLTGTQSQIINDIDFNKEQNLKNKFFIAIYRKLILKEEINFSVFPPEYYAIYLFSTQMKSSELKKDILEQCIKLSPYFEDPYSNLSSIGESNIKIPNNYYQNRFSITDSISYYKILFGLDNEKSIFNNSLIIESFDLEIKTSAIDKWVTKDIEKMIEICNQQKIQIVLMNYPMLNKSTLSYSVNQILSDIAIKHELPFVDNTQIFDTITTDRMSYFISDGHCSDKGYKLMAQSIFNILVKNKMLEKLKKENAK